MAEYWSVPRLWPGGTVVIVAGGPSLARMDLSVLQRLCRRPPVIVINDGYRLIPSADLLYFCDFKWFEWHRAAVCDWPGLAVTLAIKAHEARSRIRLLRQGDVQGLADDPGVLNTGRNSGYQAIGLAVHGGAKRIVLVGFDMCAGPDGRSHWHDGHQGRQADPRLYARTFLPHFPSLIAPLQARGVEVVNATIGGALDVFPRVSLDEELELWHARNAA